MNRHPDIAKELNSISPAVANLNKNCPLTLPTGYFSTLPHQVLEKIRAMETLEADAPSALLGSLSRRSPLSLPEGYFKSLPESLLEKTVEAQKEQEPAKIIPIFSRSAMVKLAAAAVVTAIIAGTAWWFAGAQNGQDSLSAPVAAQIEATNEKDSLAIDEEALLVYLGNTASLANEDLIPKPDTLDQKDLLDLDFSTERISEILQDIPENELMAFVAENPVPEPLTDMN